jgi:tetrahydromethanopterin S-methyltransferase subunit G
MRSTWTDSRLDEFKDRVDSRLAELSQSIGEQSGRIDSLQQTMIHAFIALVAIMITGFVGLAGLIATQL